MTTVAAVHELAPRDLDWIPVAPLRVQESRDIGAPAASVFAIVADHEGWSSWFEGVSKVEVTGAPTGVGGQRRVHLGRIVVDEVFIGWEDDRLFAFTLTGLSKRLVRSMAESVRVEPLEDGRCRVTYSMGIEPRPGLKAITRLVTLQLGGRLRKALGKLAEKAASPTG